MIFHYFNILQVHSQKFVLMVVPFYRWDSRFNLNPAQISNGVDGHIFVSWLHPFKEHRLVVIGSEGMVTFEDSAEGKPLTFYSKKFDLSQGFPEKIDGKVTLIDYNKKWL